MCMSILFATLRDLQKRNTPHLYGVRNEKLTQCTRYDPVPVFHPNTQVIIASIPKTTL
jgi:hypothetical protein